MTTKKELQEKLQRLIAAQSKNSEQLVTLTSQKDAYRREAVNAIGSGKKTPVAVDFDKEINEITAIQDEVRAEIQKTRSELETIKEAEKQAAKVERQKMVDGEIVAMYAALEDIHTHASKVYELWRLSMLEERKDFFNTGVFIYNIDVEKIIKQTRVWLAYVDGQRRLKALLDKEQSEN